MWAAHGLPSDHPHEHGSRHHHHHAGARYAVVVVVARNAALIKSFGVSFAHGHCDNGDPYGSGLTVPLGGGLAISASGVAAGEHYFAKAFTLLNGGRTELLGHERVTFQVQFAGDSLTGTLHDEFTSRRTRCASGPVRFTAWRDGTPRAPLSNATTESGHYLGTGNSVHVDVPLELISEIYFTTTLHCSDGVTPGLRNTYYDVEIHGSRFSPSGRGNAPVFRGYLNRWSYRLSGSFRRRHGLYQVTWRWHYAIALYHGARLAVRCHAGSQPYSATGP